MSISSLFLLVLEMVWWNLSSVTHFKNWIFSDRRISHTFNYKSRLNSFLLHFFFMLFGKLLLFSSLSGWNFIIHNPLWIIHEELFHMSHISHQYLNQLLIRVTKAQWYCYGYEIVLLIVIVYKRFFQCTCVDVDFVNNVTDLIGLVLSEPI